MVREMQESFHPIHPFIHSFISLGARHRQALWCHSGRVARYKEAVGGRPEEAGSLEGMMPEKPRGLGGILAEGPALPKARKHGDLFWLQPWLLGLPGAPPVATRAPSAAGQLT